MIRTFIAITLSNHVKESLLEISERIGSFDKHREIRWIEKQNIHLTLAFLGNVEKKTIEELILILEQKTSSSKKFDMNIVEYSYFPFVKNPKVVAALIQNSEDLTSLSAKTEVAVRSVGIQLEKRRFTPHITLGRVKSKKRVPLKIAPAPLFITEKIESFFLIKSELSRHGAIYTPLFEFPLG